MFNRIKGTKDINPTEMMTYEFIRGIFLKITNAYNFSYVETPIIENADLYKRSVASSDIVKKEMYEFKDRGDRSISLRPEGTAGFIRALIENKWYTYQNNKFSYYGQMFRYEQPQKGRQRQFYQAGVEAIGQKNIYQDYELISMANLFLKTIGINTKLKINSIGDEQTRINYQKELKKYFLPYKNELSEINQERLETNVLRILDDKIDSQKEFVKKAPKIFDYLSEESKKYFTDLLSLLKINYIDYEIDYSLVRGLDYYDEIVYEFVSLEKNTGAQSTVIGGGRYSNLIKELGGPETSASGWAIGVDRIAEIIFDNNLLNEQYQNNKIKILFGCLNQENLNTFISLCNELRSYGIKSEIIKTLTKSKKIFEKAEKTNADFIIFDDKAEQKNTFLVKHLKTNDKIYFSHNESGFDNLLHFLSDNDDEIYEILDELAETEEE
ncbi:MAG: histidine--tRNA ligase [Metamycoplasmataceae bacterium]